MSAEPNRLAALIVPGAHVMRLGSDMSPPGRAPSEQKGIMRAVSGGRAQIQWLNDDGSDHVKTWLSLASLGKRWTWLHAEASP